MLDDRQLSKVCWTLYLDQPTDYWDHLFPHDGGYAGVVHMGDIDVVCWRGSTTLFDWLEDFQAGPTMYSGLGMVHSGFLEGVNSVCTSVNAVVGERFINIGHSLGAGHAAIYSAKRIVMGKPPLKTTLWGCPRPGFQGLQDILNAKTAPIITSYKNRKDPVTDVPVNIGTYKYVDATNFTMVNVAPSFMDAWGPLADHHFNLYATAMEALYPPTRETINVK